MGNRIAFIGIGAVGGYAAAHMAHKGEDVVAVDPWPEHVQYIRKNGMQIFGTTPAERLSVPMRVLHVCDVQQLAKEKPIDIAFISVKSYDTEWATRLLLPYLAPNGFFVSLQNCINEERIASIAGWGRTVGAIVALLAAECTEPGHVHRNVGLGNETYIDYRVGETHGRITKRAEEVARLLRHSDSATTTDNLWGERWSKLVINAMRNGLSSVSGLGGNERDTNATTLRVGIQLGAEAVRVGLALGYQLEPMVKIPPEVLAKADLDDRAFEEACETIHKVAKATTRNDKQRPSMAQDIAKGRRTETEFINGYVAARGAEAGIQAPTNAGINELVLKLERGEIKAGVEAVAPLVNRVPVGAGA